LEAALVAGQPVQSSTIQHAALATAINSTGVNQGYFDGILDEVRIWNYARSLGQIRSAINSTIDTATPSLVARWSLNEGAANDVGSGAVVSARKRTGRGRRTAPTTSWSTIRLACWGPADNATGVRSRPRSTSRQRSRSGLGDGVVLRAHAGRWTRRRPASSSSPTRITRRSRAAAAAAMNSQEWVVDNLDTRNIV
jgi:hypothetical protein